jgi:hypothetical protein
MGFGFNAVQDELPASHARPAGPSLFLAPGDWRSFTGQVKTGAFDLP